VLVKLAAEAFDWKKTTTCTVLKRLCDRGIFRNENGTVSAVISRYDYYARHSEQYVEETFGGSLPAFLAAFGTRRKMTAKNMEMSCDEAVIRKMGEEVRADYSASLLTLATGRRIIAGTPLAFGEGSTESRIKNLSGWRKPVLCVVIAAVIGGGVLAVCLLTDRIAEKKLAPIGPRTYTVTEVTYEGMSIFMPF